MQLRFFSVPVIGGEAAADELNRFLATHRIHAVDRHLAQDGHATLWAICVGFDAAGGDTATAPRRGKVDYKEVLNDADFSVFAALRTLRKDMADREGVPPYALFTNEQLAEMVTRRVASVAALREIPGIGAARVDKYGRAFLEALAAERQASGDEPQAASRAQGQADET